MEIQPCTQASIQLARQAQARDRAEVERVTGLRIADDGQIVLKEPQPCQTCNSVSSISRR